MKNFAKLTSIKIMIFGFARIYLCKRLAKSELKLANWKLGFQFSGLIQATADFIVKINGNFEDTDQRCAEQIKGEVK